MEKGLGFAIKIFLLAAIAIFVLFTLFKPAQSPEPVNKILIQNCVQISCISEGSTANCTCNNVTSSDNIYPNTTLDSGLRSANNLAQIQTWHNQTDIQNGSRILNVQLGIEWTVTASGGNCTIEIYNGSWQNVSDTCRTTENLDIFNISNIINNE